eukprot:gnl/TRDRNA2_/TRDRNA2_86758_c0_seq1.p1 gnl/TRDRNA2_/TRDRNA2_86758_c0~~gnl/TRDRNA2_/TRDRNA2_86758_c0_seq1.p1  ORF type:complete len:238 (-),score=29.38 gnl/TRDRNA2_/TRDRNA2_86758_c0_seq1:236-949(-)
MSGEEDMYEVPTSDEEEDDDVESPDLTGTPPTDLDVASPAFMYPIIMLGELGIGYLVAWGVYSFDKASVAVKIMILKEYGLGYLYLAVVVAVRIPYIMQTFVALEGRAAKASTPEQYMYKTMVSRYVRLENRGRVGRFNRAQRAVENMRETFPGILASLILGGFVYPVPALITAIVLLAGRIMFSVGYIWRDGLKMPGMILSSLAGIIAGGFLLFSAVQALICHGTSVGSICNVNKM